MAEDQEATEETPSGDEIKTRSDELTEGMSKTATGISRIVLGLWRRLDGHPILKFSEDAKRRHRERYGD